MFFICVEIEEKNNTTFSIEYFGNHVTMIRDETYIYLGRSNSNQIQPKTYLGQKSVLLEVEDFIYRWFSQASSSNEIHVFYCTKLIFLDTIGPFSSTINDASIAKVITCTCDELINWCEKDDLIILDREFRDVVDVFIDLGYGQRMAKFSHER